MSEKSLWEKLIENVPLVITLIGVTAFILAASDNISLGNISITISDPAWKIALGIISGIFVLIGLLVYFGDRLGVAKSTRVKTFDDIQKFLTYVNEKLEKAEMQIDDLSWRGVVEKSDDLEPVQKESLKYHGLIKQVARKTAYREVFIFNRRDRADKAYALLADNANGYSCAYYEPTNNPPLISFMIIDRKEVLILNVTDGVQSIAIKQPEIVDVFVKYYNEIWNQSIKMKQGKDVFWDSVETALGKDKAEALKLIHGKTSG